MPSALATDLYEITMAAGYHAHGLEGQATFELYVRALPASRHYLVAAGLEQALDFLEQLRLTEDEIAYLRDLPNLQGVEREFFDRYLPGFGFHGDVWAMPEGTPVFPPAPLLRVTAPLPEAQVVETSLLSILMFQTGVASKAARVVDAADGRAVVEFGARRAHGVEAACFAARAAYVAGCESTSNVEAGYRFGIPLSGTMAHAWVTGFPTELESFRRYAETYGERAVLLLDTYDTVAAARLIVADEPTTALDVSIQAQIITLLKNICKSRGAAVMLITHDMGVIAETCDRVAVLYAGRVAEIGPVHDVINQPSHPYTAGLMASIPDMEQDRERLNQIDGAMPRLNAIPPGCAYNPRCPKAFDRCRTEEPELRELETGHRVRCHFAQPTFAVQHASADAIGM